MANQNFKTTFQTVVTGLNNLQTQVNLIQKNTAQMQKLVSQAQRTKNSMANLDKQAKSFTITWKGVVRVMAGSLISRGVAQVTNQLNAATSRALDFSKALAEVKTISSEGGLTTASWSRELTKLAAEFNTSRVEQAEAAYQALSNGIRDNAEALEFLTSANKLARATLSTVDEAVLLLSGTINSFGLNVSEAERLAKEFYGTVKVGRLRLNQIANSLGKVNVLAAQLGATTTDVNAALATLTKKGITANESLTLIRAVFQKMIQPTDRMTELFAEWGVEGGKAANTTLGFAEVLKRLLAEAEKSGDSLSEFGVIANRVRGILGLAALTDDMENNFIKTRKEIEDSAVAFDKASKAMKNNLSYDVRSEINKTKIAFENWGEELAQTFAKMNEAVGGFTRILQTLVQAMKTLAPLALAAGFTKLVSVMGLSSAAAAVLTGKMTVAAAVMRGLSATVVATRTAFLTLFATPVGWFALIAAGSYMVVRGFQNMAQSAKEKAAEAKAAWEQFGHERLRLADEVNQKLISQTNSAVDKMINAYKRQFAAVRGMYNKLARLGQEQKSFQDQLRRDAIDEAKERGQIGKARNLLQDSINKKLEESKEILATEPPDGLTAGMMEDLGDLREEIKQLNKELSSLVAAQAKARAKQPRRRPADWQNQAAGRELGYGRGDNMTSSQRVADNLAQMKAIDDAILNSLKKHGDVTKAASARARESVEGWIQAMESWEGKARAIQEAIKAANDEMLIRTATATEQLKTAREALENVDSPRSPKQTRGFDPYEKSFRDLQPNLARAKELLAEERTLTEAEGAELRALGEGFLERAKGMHGAFAEENRAFLEQAATAIESFSTEAAKGAEMATKVKALGEAQLKVAEQAKDAAIQLEGLTQRGAKAIDMGAGVMIDAFTVMKTTGDSVVEGFAGSVNLLNQSVGKLGGELTRVSAMVAEIQKQIAAANAAAAAAAAASAGQKSVGGFIYRAAGGTVGTDSVPAMLSPGEFVMNAASSRKFMPQLIGMNSNKRFETGGTVSNSTNVGDVNVNVTNNNEPLNARRIGEQIRRELQRKTLRLN